MRSLVWKEFREKRLWLIPLAAATVGLVLLRQGYTFCGALFANGPWVAVSAVVALLAGTGTYSNELKNDTTDFLFSRPVNWRRVMLAKLGVGLGMILAVSLLSAVVYRITVPEPYLPFTTLADLTKGVGWAMLIMGAPYLLGAACSVVLPGTIGTILTMLSLAIAIGVESLLINEAVYVHSGSQPMAAYVPVVSWLLAILVAGSLMARFGLTLSAPARVVRYVLMVFMVLVAAIPLDMVFNNANQRNILKPRVVWAIVSPTGKSVLHADDVPMLHADDVVGGTVWSVTRLSDKTTMPTAMSPWDSHWYGDTRYTLKWSGSADPRPYRLLIERMDAKGKRQTTSIDLGKHAGMVLEPSPNGRWVATIVRKVRGEHVFSNANQFIDIKHAKLLNKQVIYNTNLTPQPYWWVSNSEFAYIDNQNVRHTVRMPEGVEDGGELR